MGRALLFQVLFEGHDKAMEHETQGPLMTAYEWRQTIRDPSAHFETPDWSDGETATTNSDFTDEEFPDEDSDEWTDEDIELERAKPATCEHERLQHHKRGFVSD